MVLDLERIRSFAAENVMNRAIVYFAVTVLAAILASLLISFLRLPMTPPYAILLTMILMIVGFYLVDPENAYTEADVLSIVLTAVFLTAFMALIAYSAKITIIKQYAAPLVFMQEAGNATASAMQIPSSDILGLALMNLWAWTGGLSIAMGIKQIITARRQ